MKFLILPTAYFLSRLISANAADDSSSFLRGIVQSNFLSVSDWYKCYEDCTKELKPKCMDLYNKKDIGGYLDCNENMEGVCGDKCTVQL